MVAGGPRAVAVAVAVASWNTDKGAGDLVDTSRAFCI